ncbi:MAG TPA: alpha/beta fold hydrolase [Thermomonospora sp.]|nr:alpha/beta fold hydrolase [Thermomonospora sp.]
MAATTTANEDGAWIRRFHPGPQDGPRLVCFPHAGGSASFYHPLSATLAPFTETLTVQYPGRQDRRAEPPATTIEELADRAFAALRPWADRRLALFGHSMGALVAYEVARRLEERTGTPPTVLVASGRRAPSIHRPETAHARDDAGLLAELRRLSGTDESLLGDEEIQRMILPALRADYAALDSYRFTGPRSLSCPVTVLYGDRDPVTSAADARAWEFHTTGPFDLQAFPGGHFYLAQNQSAVSGAISRALQATRT